MLIKHVRMLAQVSASDCVSMGRCAGDELDGCSLRSHMQAVDNGLSRPGMRYSPQELELGVRCAAEVLLFTAPRLMEVWACSGSGQFEVIERCWPVRVLCLDRQFLQACKQLFIAEATENCVQCLVCEVFCHESGRALAVRGHSGLG